MAEVYKGEIFNAVETAKRRDEVVRRMANTPPQPHVSGPSNPRKKKAVQGQPSPKRGARKAYTSEPTGRP